MLKYIKTKKCPICGCTEIINESVEISKWGDKPKIREHCNGGRWEKREFLCGYETEYVPNFSSEQVTRFSECFYDPKVIARKEKTKQDKEKLEKILIENDVPQEVIDRFKNYYY